MKKCQTIVRLFNLISLVLMSVDFIILLVKAVSSMTVQTGVYPAFTTVMCFILPAIILVTALILIFKSSSTAVFGANAYCVARMVIITFESRGQLDGSALLKLVILSVLFVILMVFPNIYKKRATHLICKITAASLAAFMAAISVSRVLSYISMGFWIFYAMFFTLSDGLFFTALVFMIIASISDIRNE